MKKLLTIILTLTLVLGLGTVAFAQPTPAQTPSYEDWESVPITKNILLTNTETKNPTETYTFTIGTGTVTNSQATVAPTFGDDTTFTITVNEGVTSGTYVLNLPEFKHVGVYTYPITETEGSTAGIIYDTASNNLVITVINNPKFGETDEPEFLRLVTLTDEENENKVEAFENTFQAGNLSIYKEVTGNMGEKDRYFDITITLNAPAGKNISTVPVIYDGGKYKDQVVNFANGTAILNLEIKDGDTITIENLPYGVTWSFSEEDLGDEYVVTDRMANGTISAGTVTNTIINDKDRTVETGITLDNLPYLIILAVVIGGLILFVTRRRLSHNE